MPSIELFEKNGTFHCPICGMKISSRRKPTIAYVTECGEHYEACAKSISKEQLSNILERIRHAN